MRLIYKGGMATLPQTSTMIATLVLLVVTCLSPALTCMTNGICGGGLGGLGGLGCMPQLPSPGLCQQGCGPGYQCGPYGCARRRARVHGSNTFIRREKISQQHMNPNEMFRQCCEERGLPDACVQKCHYNTFTRDALMKMYLKQDACPIQASSEIQFCAAQGRDHRACCARNGVTTTLAGAKCLLFCDQRPGNITRLDVTYVSCYDRFENMKACFWHDIVGRIDSQLGPSNTITA